MQIDKSFIVDRQGKTFVLYAGLLQAAHADGLKRITTTLLQAPCDTNNHTAIMHAQVETARGTFDGIGDANASNVGRMIAMHTIRMAECVPLQARILTRRGFCYYDELSVGEDVLAYDIENDETVWTPLQAVSVFTDPYPVVRLQSRSFEAVCTPNHTWASRPQRCKGRLVQAAHLGITDKIVVAAKAEGGESPLDPREAAILGWLATDGTVRESMTGSFGPYLSACVRQSKPHYVEELAALVGADGYHRQEAARERDFGAYISHCLPQSTFALRAGFARELLAKAGWSNWSDLPRIVTTLSQEARETMLDAMLKGDGSARDGRRWVFGKKAKPGVMEAFEILATLEGRALGIPRKSTVGDVPVRSLRENRHISAAHLAKEPAGEMPVWCPTTAYGTWVMNYCGCISITGNTRAKARALRDAINVGYTALEELGGDDDEPAHTPRRAAEPAPQRPAHQAPQPAAAHAERPTSAIPGAPASRVQLDRLAKLLGQLGRPVDAELLGTLTAGAAEAQIKQLAAEFNQRASNRGGNAPVERRAAVNGYDEGDIEFPAAYR